MDIGAGRRAGGLVLVLHARVDIGAGRRGVTTDAAMDIGANRRALVLHACVDIGAGRRAGLVAAVVLDAAVDIGAGGGLVAADAAVHVAADGRAMRVTRAAGAGDLAGLRSHHLVVVVGDLADLRAQIRDVAGRGEHDRDAVVGVGGDHVGAGRLHDAALAGARRVGHGRTRGRDLRFVVRAREQAEREARPQKGITHYGSPREVPGWWCTRGAIRARYRCERTTEPQAPSSSRAPATWARRFPDPATRPRRCTAVGSHARGHEPRACRCTTPGGDSRAHSLAGAVCESPVRRHRASHIRMAHAQPDPAHAARRPRGTGRRQRSPPPEISRPRMPASLHSRGLAHRTRGPASHGVRRHALPGASCTVYGTCAGCVPNRPCRAGAAICPTPFNEVLHDGRDLRPAPACSVAGRGATVTRVPVGVRNRHDPYRPACT